MQEQGIKTSDWATFRAQAQRMLDAALTQMEQAADHPWQPVPEDISERYALDGTPRGAEAAVDQILRDVLPYHGGNTHPRFWGWVQGSGLPSDIVASIAAACVNANMGGRDHGANYMERAVVDWTRRQMGLPDSASGLLVTGTSQATVIAFQAARLRVCPDLRNIGQAGVRLTAYAGAGVHNAARKAVEVLGIGADNLRKVPLTEGQLDTAALRRMVAEDRAAGATPFLVVGTAGSVDLGQFDDLNALADAAADLGLWLHVDGAFGAWTRIAAEPYRALSDGIGRADSIALDFHKWMYVGYDCGVALLRHETEHRAAFAARPSYLEGADRGLAGGEPWFCDYGIDLSRGNRALKVWTALQTYGDAAFSEAITLNCQLAKQMGEEVAHHQQMALAEPVVSNVCVFTARRDLPEAAQSQTNARIAQVLQEQGEAVFSTTRVNDVVLLRAAITNHRTQPADITAALQAVAREAAV